MPFVHDIKKLAIFERYKMLQETSESNIILLKCNYAVPNMIKHVTIRIREFLISYSVVYVCNNRWQIKIYERHMWKRNIL